jgi:hypothetical protein
LAMRFYRTPLLLRVVSIYANLSIKNTKYEKGAYVQRSRESAAT